MMRISLLTCLAAFLFVCVVKQPANGQFPDEFNEAFESGERVLLDSGALGGGTHWYLYCDESGVERILLRYMIGGESFHQLGFDSDNPEITELRGFAWLDARTTYGATSSAVVTCLMEHVRPSSVFGSPNISNTTFQLTLDPMILSGESSGNFTSITCGATTGNMESNGVQNCLSCLCEIGGEFELVGLRYEENENDVLEYRLDGDTLAFCFYSQYFTFPGDRFEDAVFESQKFQHEISITQGDANLDGKVDLLDVSAFIDLLSLGAYQLESDINLDLRLDLLDVAGFVAILSN